MRDTYFRYKAILIDISWFASCFTRGMVGWGVKQNSLKTLKHFYASLGITFQSDLPTLVLDQKNACYFIFILAAMPPKGLLEHLHLGWERGKSTPSICHIGLNKKK